MVENLGRKLILIALLLGASLALLLLPDQPFRMGLDLQGGTRLVYRLDFDKIEQATGEKTQAGQIQRDQILQQTLTIIRNRVDPDGVLEPIIRAQGTDRIVIELPGTPELHGETVETTLQQEIDARSTLLQLDPAAQEGFPTAGGTVYVDAEKVEYGRREGNLLLDLRRGAGATTHAAHEVGATIRLASNDEIRNRIENLGELQFVIVAQESDLGQETGTDLVTERQKLEAWFEGNWSRPGFKISQFNAKVGEPDGPHPGLRWYPTKPSPEQEAQLPDDEEQLARYYLSTSLPTLAPAGPDDTFRGEHLSYVGPDQDRNGFPAVRFEFEPARKNDFAEFTERNLDRRMAIVLNDQIESAPVINSRLPGGGIIEGRYKQTEVNALVTVLRSGSLPIELDLEADERVGPSLGADYVRRGKLSTGVALAAVLLFMILYYRRLGVYAALALGSTLLMLLGGLILLDATLTLPGIAGIILTVGMAVDANILIFDRLREEMDKGRNAMQAAKNGFDQALSAIVDANLTTLITALILLRFGTGPVRGFAWTLSIGVLTSMFSALVITRVLVHMQLERGIKRFSMGTWLVTADWKFMGKARVAAISSLVAIVAGCALFLRMPDREKLGIDFLGGWDVHVRTEEPQPTDTIRNLIGGIPGDIGDSAEVKPVQGTTDGAGRYKEFRVTFKGEGQTGDTAGSRESKGDQTYRTEIERALADILQRGPVELEQADGHTSVHLYFEEAHAVEDVRQALVAAGLGDPQVTQDPDSPTRYRASSDSSVGLSDTLALETAILGQFEGKRDSAGTAYELSQSVPSSSQVGPQVVGELRDQAILAILISLFAIVMYIRVRFAEYSYGIAAVVAVLHDVLVTLGVLAVVLKAGLVDAEINLPMIAAFLTIIGYSLNDTIVLFDRVRENLPRMKAPLAEILNTSINQTLSRTILTSLTTFLAVAILFGINYGTGNVLEGFAFAMMCGVVVGTYSSIYIAAPMLLWLETRRGTTHGKGETGGKKKKSAVAAEASA